MRPLTLYASGFQGIRHGLGLEEIEADLAGLEGIVALTGDNGRGKSTFLGLLQPWPWLPDHGQNLYGQVFRPALKELVFLADGKTWKSVVKVNPKRRQVKAELLVQAGENWVPAEMDGIKSTGAVKPYLALLEKLLGPSDLFFRAAFRPQTAASLALLSPAAMKEVFVSALDLPHLEEIGRRAARVKNALADRAAALEGQQEKTRREIAELREKADAGRQAGEEAAALERKLGEARRRKEEAVAKLAGIKAARAEAEKLRQRAKEAMNRLEEAQKKEAALQQEIASVRKESEAKAARVAGEIEKARKLVGRKPRIQRAASILARVEARLERLEKASEASADTARKLADLRKNLAGAEKEIERINAELGFLARRGRELRRTADILKEVPCRRPEKEKCPLLGEAIRASRRIDPLRAEYRKQAAALQRKEKEAASIRKEIEALEKTEEKWRRRARAAAKLRRAASALREEASLLPHAEAAEKAAAEAEARLKEIEKEKVGRIADLEKSLDSLKREIPALEKAAAEASSAAEIPDPAPLEKQLRDLEAEIQKTEKDLARARARAAEAEAAAKMAEGLERNLAETENQISILRARARRFDTLHRAFSKDGIVALEIEDVGPFLTSEANALLKECMGGRFTVNIRLQAEAARGNGTKETMEILVYDSRSPDGKPKLLGDLSGGEAAVVEPVIAHALALLDVSRAGGKFLAAFCDETLSRLSPQNRLEAFESFRRFHRRAGFQVSFLVTHEEDVWARCDHVLRFEDGGIQGLPHHATQGEDNVLFGSNAA